MSATRTNLFVAAAILLAGSQAALADIIPVVSYSMTNGAGIGNWAGANYFDSSYTGSGNKTAEGVIFDQTGKAIANPNALLTCGTGLLTDGKMSTQNYSVAPAEYVAWKYIDPTITFNLGPNASVQSINLSVGLSPVVASYTDSTGQLILGSGLVGAPASVWVSINGGASTLYTPVSSSVTGNSEILSIIFPELAQGDTFTLALNRGALLHDGIDYNNFYNKNLSDIRDPQFYLNAGQPNLEPWIMLSEVQFMTAAVPEPSTWLMMIVGFAGVSFAAYRRKAKAEPALA
jgi:hypothetical protein